MIQACSRMIEVQHVIFNGIPILKSKYQINMETVHLWVQHHRQSKSDACANHWLIRTRKSNRNIS